MNKLPAISFLSLFLCSLSMTTIAADHNIKEKSVTEFGARPDDGRDDTRALRAAIEWARHTPGATLTFPPGVYRLKDAQAEQLERDVLEGKMGANPEQKIFTPYFSYVRGLDLAGSEGLTIMAQGATLLCEGWMEPITIEDCTNTRLCGLTIDYARRPFSAGKVVAVTPQYFEVEFPTEREITETMPLTRMTFWIHEQNRLYPDPIYFPKRELLGNGRIRFHHTVPEQLLGATAGVLHSFHFRPAILIHRSQNTTIEDVTIHAQPGMGIVGFDSRDIDIERLQVVPAPGQCFSTNTDATHFACCEGKLRLNACRFRGQGDDATNVHGYYQCIVAARGKEADLEVKAPTYTHAQVADVPRPGDCLELVERTTLKLVRTYEVVEAHHMVPQRGCTVTLSDTLPQRIDDYYLMNVTKLPSLVFENSLVDSHLARGVLVKTRDVVIRGNVFRHGTGTAIHIGAEGPWHEGTYAKNVLVENNTILGCGLGAGRQNGACGIALNITAPDASASFLHDSIRIERNHIAGSGNDCGIYLGNANHVFVNDNHVTGCRTAVCTHSVADLRAQP